MSEHNIVRTLPHGAPRSREREAFINADFYDACKVPGSRAPARVILRTLARFERLGLYDHEPAVSA